MSGIYIKGVSIPGNCCSCFAADSNGSCRITRKGPTFEEWYEQRGADCPLVPVPDHGKLIDADSRTFPTPHRNPSNDYMRGWNTCLRSVQQQSTIIPAEEEAEE